MTENQTLATKLSLTLRDIQECIARVKFVEANYHDAGGGGGGSVGDTYISRSGSDSSSFNGTLGDEGKTSTRFCQNSP